MINKFIFEKIKQALKESFELSRPADTILSYFFKNNKNLGVNERRLIAEIYFGVIRNKLFYETISEKKDLEDIILKYLFFENKLTIDLLKKLGSDFQYSEEDLNKSKNQIKNPLIKFSVPELIAEQLKYSYDSDKLKFIYERLAQPAYLDIRVNLNKEKSQDVVFKQIQEDLEINSNNIRKTKYSPIGIRLPRGTQIQNISLFKDGIIEVQEEGSQILSYLVDANRNQMVADFCAGAGGKTLAIGALMSNKGRLYAFDVSDRRLQNLKKRFKRSGLSNVVSYLIKNENDIRTKRLKGKFDRVLVDAPCSGLGTIRRNPDLKWKHNHNSIKEMQIKQYSILNAAAKLCKIGGRLIYATCSIMSEENEDIVDKFLLENNSFKLIEVQPILDKYDIPIKMNTVFKVRLDEHEMDGFFAAIFEKIK